MNCYNKGKPERQRFFRKKQQKDKILQASDNDTYEQDGNVKS